MAYYAPFYQPTYYSPAPTRQDVPQYNQQYQPMAQTAPQQIAQPMAQQNNNGLIWVQGEAGAKSYLVAPGNTVMLMDAENSTFYLKSADASGMPLPLRIFDYKERSAMPSQPTSAPTSGELVNFDNFVTRKEFEELKASIASQPTPKKTKNNLTEVSENV